MKRLTITYSQKKHKRTLWQRIWDPLNAAAWGPLDMKGARTEREKQEAQEAAAKWELLNNRKGTMTRDEHRAACIAAIDAELSYEVGPTEFRRKLAERIFDALPTTGVRVCPIEATEEMLHAARNYFADGLTAYEAIASVGDLTNPPGRKP